MARPRIFRSLKYALARSGLRPSRLVTYINGVLAFGRWRRENEVPIVLDSKADLYVYLQKEVLEDGPVDYLEFGVWKGWSLRRWVDLNSHPESRFFGFDSFEGLPEDWGHFTTLYTKGTFSTGGKTPAIDDRRVQWIKGYFQDSLGPFLKGFTPRNRLVIHCDADLYTSTLFVLTMLDAYLVPGTIIMFDEFFTVDHEFRAFNDYIRAYRKHYRVVAGCGPCDQVAIKVTG